MKIEIKKYKLLLRSLPALVIRLAGTDLPTGDTVYRYLMRYFAPGNMNVSYGLNCSSVAAMFLVCTSLRRNRPSFPGNEATHICY